MKIVVGLGITGRALIRFFLKQGTPCAGFEELSEENYRECLSEFEGSGIKMYFGSLPHEIFDLSDGFFASPGVPLTRPWVHEARKRAIPVAGELEFASRFLYGSIIAVTGTNGKSTTVSLLHAILKEGGFKSSLKGNIGSPLITAVTEPRQDYYVVEVSSYQLETIDAFHPKISVVLNVTEDHLDRYANIESYASAKAGIFMNQGPDDYLIYNADDPFCVRMSRKSKAQNVPFSLVNVQKKGGFIEREEMVVRLFDRETRFPLGLGSLCGLHNQENKLAAVLAATLAGVPEDRISAGIKNFRPLSHRLEFLGSWKGVSFYDDSKGTNVWSVVMSLASFEKNVILILGGRDKGGDYSPLKPLIRHKARAVVVLGEAKDRIAKALEGERPIYTVKDMKEAVQKSCQIASSGDVVLLSPACSSFDQYKNYAERGNDFKKWAEFFGSLDG